MTVEVEIKKCMVGLVEKYKEFLEIQANNIYENTIIRKLPTYLKKILTSYPSSKNTIFEYLLKSFPHKDKPQIVNLLVYQRFAIKLASLLSNSLCPEAESKVFELIVDNITSLDVEIKVRMRKGTHLEKFNNIEKSSSANQQERKQILNSIFQRIESKQSYSKRMLLRNQDEKEIKAELLLKSFMHCIDDKVKQMNKGGKRSIQKFSEFFMKLTCEKILSVSQSNFIQYIPFYIVLKAKRSFDLLELKGMQFDKNSSCEFLFVTCFISELI